MDFLAFLFVIMMFRRKWRIELGQALGEVYLAFKNPNGKFDI